MWSLVPLCMCKDQKTTSKSQFSHITYVPGMERRSSDLAASVFSCCAMSPTLEKLLILALICCLIQVSYCFLWASLSECPSLGYPRLFQKSSSKIPLFLSGTVLQSCPILALWAITCASPTGASVPTGKPFIPVSSLGAGWWTWLHVYQENAASPRST